MTVYAAPGTAGALIDFKPRYEHFIGGEWVKPVEGAVLRGHLARERQAVHRGRARQRGGHRRRARRRSQGCARLGPDQRRAPRRHPERDRRPHRREPRTARRRRDVGQRQVDPRAAQRRPPARERPLPVLREPHPRAGGQLHAARRGHRRVPLQRAARRGRPDHPVELPAAHGDVEARAGARRRQLRGAEARRADPDVDPRARRAHRRPAARRACSTSSTASASRPASRSRRRTASARSRSRARRRRAGSSCSTRRRTSSRRRSSSAARARTSSSSRSPTSATRSTTRRRRASACSPSTRARSAPARAASLIQKPIYDTFLDDALERTKQARQGNPLDTDTQVGAQASNDQLEKILSYIDIGKQEGARLLLGGERVDLGGDLSDGYYVAPTIFEGQNRCGSSRRRSSARWSR